MAEIVTIGEKQDKEDVFIQSYVETGDCQKAAKDAGYAHGTYGYQLRDKLADEIREAVNVRIAGVAPMALGTLTKLAEGAESESVRRQAAKDIMSLGGFDIQRTEDLTEKRDTRTDAEIKASIADAIADDPEWQGMVKERMG